MSITRSVGLRLTFHPNPGTPAPAAVAGTGDAETDTLDVVVDLTDATSMDSFADALRMVGAPGAAPPHRWVHGRTRQTISGPEAVESMGLRWGDQLFADPIQQHGVRVAVTSGPHQGLVVTLAKAGLMVGRRSGDLQLPGDLAVSDPHVRIRVDERTGGAHIQDLGSRFGTFVDNEQITEATVAIGETISVGDSQIRLVGPSAASPTGAELGVESHPEGGDVLRREPRVTDPVIEATFHSPRAPDLPPPRRFPLAAALAPMLMGGAMVLVTGRMIALLFVAAAPLIALWSFLDDRIVGRRRMRQATATFHVDLGRCIAETSRRHEASIAQRRRSVRTPDDCRRDVEHRAPTLWSRATSNPDVLEIAIGAADQPSTVTLRPPDAGDAGLMTEATLLATTFDVARAVPVVIDLARQRIIGIVGLPEDSRAVARSLIVQLSCSVGPSSLRIGAPANDDWAWIGWLPHARSHSPAHHTVSIVETDGSTIDRSTIAVEVNAIEATADVVVWCASAVDQLPDRTDIIVRVHPLGGGDARPTCSVTSTATGHVIADVHEWRCSLPAARSIAVGMSPLIDDRGTAGGSALPARVDATAAIPVDLRATLTDNWSAPSAGLSFVLGVGSVGAEHIDLAEVGPHALVAGTTGSGKSALLRAWLSSAAVLSGPERLNMILIDYKASAAFAELARLPHVVGLVTHLDRAETHRSMLALNAELERRQRVLGEAGVEDIAALWADRPDIAMPRLLVVIDEFRALKEALPAFVDGVVDVASRGRNVGIHLIMATQRPEGVVSADIQANTELRVCLRVSSSADAREVLGTADAADISAATPGRFIARVDGRSVSLQACFVDDAVVPGTDRAVVVRQLTADSASTAASADLQADDSPTAASTPTGIARLIDAASAVWESTGRPSPHRPWLDALPTAISIPSSVEWGETGADRTGPDDRSRFGRRSELAVELGVVDDPTRQRQIPWIEDLAADGAVMIYGRSGAGVTTLLATWIARLCARFSPSELHVFGIDASGGDLGVLSMFPQCPAVVSVADVARLRRLLAMLTHELDRRFSSRSADEPSLVLVVDGYGALHSTLTDEFGGTLRGQFDRLVADGPGVGIFAMIGAERRGAVPSTVVNSVPRSLVMSMATDEDLVWLGARHLRGVELPPGRVGLGPDLTAQVAQLVSTEGQLAPPDSNLALSDVVGAAASYLNGRWERSDQQGRRPPRVEDLPTRVAISDVLGRGTEASTSTSVAIGLDESGDVAGPDFGRANTFVVIGPPAVGRTSSLIAVTRSFAEGRDASRRYLIAGRRSVLESLDGWSGTGRGEEAGRGIIQAVIDDLSLLDPARETTAPTLVVVDDLDEILDGSLAPQLDKLVRLGRDHDVWVAASMTSYRVPGSFQPIVRSLIGARHGLVMSPDPLVDGDPLGLRLPRWDVGSQRAGRGHLVTPAGISVIQVGY